MKTRVTRKLLLTGCTLLTLLTACATPKPTYAPRPTALPPVEVPAGTTCQDVGGTCLELIFDSEACIYQGPTEVGTGPIALLFHNKSDGEAAVNFLELLEGRTIEDVIEDMGEEPATGHHPWWSRELGSWQPIPAGKSQQWETDLKPGDYFMVCVRMSPLGVWLGTGLTAR